MQRHLGESKFYTPLVLIVLKIVNFFFIASVIGYIDHSYGLGADIIQGTAVSSVLVGFFIPVVYSLIANASGDDDNILALDWLLLVVYVVLLLCVVATLMTFSLGLASLVFALSLMARGLCDAVVALEGRILIRGILALLIVEPIRWSLFFVADQHDYVLIIFLLALPVVVDIVIRFSRYRALLNNIRSGLLNAIKCLRKLVASKTLLAGYKIILFAQLDQVFIYFWSENLSASEAIIYIFSTQVLGIILLIYLPKWINLLRNASMVSDAEKNKIFISHITSIYKSHVVLVTISVACIFVFFNSEHVSLLINWLLELGDAYVHFAALDIPLIIVLMTSLALFRSSFMDINLMATIKAGYIQIMVSYSVFIAGILAVYFDKLGPINLWQLVFIYLVGYFISVLVYFRLAAAPPLSELQKFTDRN